MKILKNYLYNASYQLLALILPLITTPYISRVLGPDGVGDNAYTNSIVQYFLITANLGLSLYGNREVAYIRDDKKNLAKTFWEIEILKVIMTAISMVLFIVFLQMYGEYHIYLLLQSINIIATMFDISWLYMGLEDFKKTVIRNTFIKLLSIVLIFTFIKSSRDVGIYILILSLSTLFGNLTLWPFLKNILIYRPSLGDLSPLKHLKPTLALFVPQIATQIYLVLNKTMLGAIAGARYSGFYNYSDNLVKMVLALATSLGTVMLPHIANAFSKKEYDRVNILLYKSFDYVTAVAVPMSFGLAGISHTLVPIFYGKGYHQVGTAMAIEAIVIILISWSGTVGTQYLLPTDRVGAYTKSVIFGAVTNIILNFPLIYYFGLYGAMIATVLSEFIVTFYQIVYVRKIVEINKLFQYVAQYLLFGFLMGVPIYIISVITKPSIQILIFEIFLGGCIYISLILVNRKELVLEILKKIQSRK